MYYRRLLEFINPPSAIISTDVFRLALYVLEITISGQPPPYFNLSITITHVHFAASSSGFTTLKCRSFVDQFMHWPVRDNWEIVAWGAVSCEIMRGCLGFRSKPREFSLTFANTLTNESFFTVTWLGHQLHWCFKVQTQAIFHFYDVCFRYMHNVAYNIPGTHLSRILPYPLLFIVYILFEI